MDQQEHIIALLRKYLNEQLSEAEASELDAWASETPENRRLLDRIGTEDLLVADMQAYWDLWNDTESSGREQRIRKGVQLDSAAGASRLGGMPILKRWLPYAAAMLLVASAVGYFVVFNQKPSVVNIVEAEILPGSNKATLTLADGRTINLDEAQTGIVIGTENITYTDGSSIGAVMVSGVEPSVEMLALTTPKGGTYQITLPDGSKVWLNAASTLKYPSRFSGDSREVFLEGEAYFDIRPMQGTRDTRAPAEIGARAPAEIGARASSETIAGARVSRVPFKVRTSNQTVEVLGTQFNISAYADDPATKTTLVEGSVRVAGLVGAQYLARNKSGVQLSPGQQATTRARPDESGQALPGQGATIEIREVDTEQYTNWKSGRFSFDDKPFADIMKELGRWYNVEVKYEGPVPTNRFIGGAYRTQKISMVLELLRAGGIDYRITQDGQGQFTLVVINQEKGGTTEP